jgi:phosphatidylethanolamine-binding protein (PEBP) family uncharacterized protein
MIGRLLRPLRAGTAKLACNDPGLAAPVTIDVASPEFATATTMPRAYRGTHALLPPLRWSGLPAGTEELVLIVEDADVPFPAPLVHAIAYAMTPAKDGLAAGEIPTIGRGKIAQRLSGISLGKAAGFAPGYLPVTPIPGHGPHRYVYQLFALDRRLPLLARPPLRRELLPLMVGRVLARGSTIGLAEA